jgi:hypothetical protein
MLMLMFSIRYRTYLRISIPGRIDRLKECSASYFWLGCARGNRILYDAPRVKAENGSDLLRNRVISLVINL